MKRRDFIAALGCAAAWPFAARAQQAKVPVIGFLGTTSQSTWSQQVAAFEQRLSELGWAVGRTIDIDYRWTEGHERTGRPDLLGLIGPQKLNRQALMSTD
jgi:putative tryptophan/tyrosine transport system substrate-binding protein